MVFLEFSKDMINLNDT